MSPAISAGPGVSCAGLGATCASGKRSGSARSPEAQKHSQSGSVADISACRSEPAPQAALEPGVAVPERELPVVLTEIEDFRPDESGVSPLARHEEWYRVPCPQCGKLGRRETDVSDTFLDSAWYFLRYPSTEFTDRAFDAARTRTWLPVSTYIGGNEHAVLHLMYSRFITMVLHDLKLLDFEEPFTRFRAHGTIVKDGAKMSKSRGNVVVPDAYINQWGADTFRMYLMFLGPYQEGGDFRDEGISGIRRFLDKVWGVVDAVREAGGGKREASRDAVVRKLHQTIHKVTDDVEALRYNTAIAALMEYLNTLREATGLAAGESAAHLPADLVEPLVVMLAPLAPHFAEECWERLGRRESVFTASWPTWEEQLEREDEVEIAVQVNGKLRGRLTAPRGPSERDVEARALAGPGVPGGRGDDGVRGDDGRPVPAGARGAGLVRPLAHPVPQPAHAVGELQGAAAV